MHMHMCERAKWHMPYLDLQLTVQRYTKYLESENLVVSAPAEATAEATAEALKARVKVVTQPEPKHGMALA